MASNRKNESQSPRKSIVAMYYVFELKSNILLKVIFYSVESDAGQDPPSKKTKFQHDSNDYTAWTNNLRRHKEPKDKGIRYQCDQCDCTATTAYNLRKHKNSKHEGIRYPCDQCDYAAKKASALKRHKESRHESIRFRYPCDQCNYAATTASNLKNRV